MRYWKWKIDNRKPKRRDFAYAPFRRMTAGPIALIAIALFVLPLPLTGCSDGDPAAGVNGTSTGSPANGSSDGELPPDSVLLNYEEAAPVDLTGFEPTSLAVDLEGNVVIAADSKVARFDPEGELIDVMLTTVGDACITVAGKNHDHPGRIYVAGRDNDDRWRVESFSPDSLPAQSWALDDGVEHNICAIVAGDADSVYLTDSAQRVIWHFDTEGELRGKIDGKQSSTGGDDNASLGFIITDIRHFDAAMGPDGLVRVVNPRRLRIEAYTSRGDRELIWGKGGSEIESFYGCCNPAHIDITPDGRVVTLEKGRPRIKIYSPDGRLESVVAQKQQLLKTPVDLAAAPDGSVWILEVDPKPRLRHFVPRRPVPTTDENTTPDESPDHE